MGRLESEGGGSWVLRWQRASGLVAAGVWAQWALQSWTLQRSVQAESPHPTLVVALPPPPVFRVHINRQLEVEPEVLDLIVDTSIENKLGARGLRSICERIMTDAMYEAPSTNKKTFKLTADYAKSRL